MKVLIFLATFGILGLGFTCNGNGNDSILQILFLNAKINQIVENIKHVNFTLGSPINSDWIAEPFIVGGDNASIGEFPYQVSIKVWEANNVSLNLHFCGGFIVDEYHVVTAAHCLRDIPIIYMEVLAGANNMKVVEPTQQYRALKRKIMHPLYNR